MARMPVIVLEKCNGCGLCVTVCKCGALVMIDNVVTVIEMDDCHWCGQCELVCPTEAITCPYDIVVG